jgi:hypothetical protein
MAATTQVNMGPDNNTEVTPNWFLKWDEGLDKRIAGVMQDTFGERILAVEQHARGANELAKEARDQCESMEDTVLTVHRENALLKSKLTSLETRLNNLEDYGRRENLIFDGIAEKRKETYIDTAREIYKILEYMKLPHYEKIKLDACHRFGRPDHNGSRRIIVRFNWRFDRTRIWENRSSLKGTGVYISEDFSAQTEQSRQKLLPAMKAARAQNAKAHIKGKTLIVDGEKFNQHELHKLSKRFMISTKSDDKSLAFFGRDAIFSNFHKANFTVDNIDYSCTEQYYQTNKAESVHADNIAAKIMSCKEQSPYKFLHVMNEMVHVTSAFRGYVLFVSLLLSLSCISLLYV